MVLDWKVDSSWTLFLDRDGVINERIVGGYILEKSEFIFKKGVLSCAEDLFSKFNYVVVVTNQQCIGKGLITQEKMDEIHRYMITEFEKNGASIDQLIVAPEVNSEVSTMRKPLAKMGLMAKDRFKDIEFSKAVMVGDTDSDMEFGRKLGMKTVLVKTDEPCISVPDVTVASLDELNQMIK